MAQLVALLRQSPGVAETMPSEEGRLVRDALDGKTVYEIAQDHSISEGAVWEILRSAARAAAGAPIAQVETGGFGSDTDPGVTGGYGETGFGSLSNEPPIATPDEPTNG
jgi:hypothetical protein